MEYVYIIVEIDGYISHIRTAHLSREAAEKHLKTLQRQSPNSHFEIETRLINELV